MKKTALLLATLAAAYGLHGADAMTSTPTYSVTVDFPYVSKYVFRGIERSSDAIQPSIEVAAGDFYAGVWTNQPVKNNTDNEFDFYAGYGIPLNQDWKLDVGGTFYYFPELDKSTGLDAETFETYVGITGKIAGFTPGVYAYYNFDLKNITLQTQVGYSIPLEAIGASVDFTATLGYVSLDDPIGGDDTYTYWGAGAMIPYKLTEKATVSVGVQYASHDLQNIADEHFWFTAGLTIGF